MVNTVTLTPREFCQACNKNSTTKLLWMGVCDEDYIKGKAGMITLLQELVDYHKQQQQPALTPQENTTITPPQLPSPIVEKPPFTPDSTTFELEFHKILNRARKDNGLSELQYDNILADLAEKHSIDMSPTGRHYYDEEDRITNPEYHNYPNPHINPSGDDASERADKVGYIGWSRYSENIARFQRSDLKNWTKQQVAQQIFNQWWNSKKGHKENMMSSNVNRHGVGIWVVNDSCWATEDLVRK